MAKDVLDKYNNLYDQIYAKLKTTYNPQSLSAVKDELQQIMRPKLNQDIYDREQLAAQNRASIDTDAADRGMLASSYVTDVKNRQNDAAARDISNINANFNSAVLSALQSRRNQQEELQFQANQAAQSAALGLTNQLYDPYYSGGGGGGGGGRRGGRSSTSNNGGTTPPYDPLGSGTTTTPPFSRGANGDQTVPRATKSVAGAMYWGEGQANKAAAQAASKAAAQAAAKAAAQKANKRNTTVSTKKNDRTNR
jgi:hypothetical protein